MAEPHSFTVATANVNKSLRGTRLHTAVAKAATADIVCWQEVETPAHVTQIEALAGYVTYWPSGRAEHDWRNACPVSFRSARFALVDGGADEVGEGIAGVQPNRPLTWVILTDRDLGGKVAAVSCHTVSGVWKNLVRKFAQWLGRNRRAESDHELAAIASRTRELAGKADMVVGGGDLNRAAKLAAHVLGADHVVYADKPTHGKHWFDVIWLVGATGSQAHRIATPSDHKVLACTVTPAGHRPQSAKPPQHRKEPTVSKETLGVDYSFARPSLSMIHGRGYEFVVRYLAGGGTSGKWLSTGERRAIHGNGMGIGVVFEAGATRTKGSATLGRNDARKARDAAAAAGIPAEVPIFAGVDFDANWAQVQAYLSGWGAELGDRAGEYAGYKIVEASHLPWHWQTAAWSGGKLSPKAHLYQRIHMTHPVSGCDENVVCHPIPLSGPGQVLTYQPGGTAPVPLSTKQPSKPKPQEDDMANMRVPVPKNAPEYKTVKSADHTVAVDTAISMLWYRVEALINEVDKLKAK